jgi:beta-galactosidase
MRAKFPRGCWLGGLFAIAGIVAANAAAPPRERVLFNTGWRFTQGDPAGVGDTLAYASLKPWLLPTAHAFIASPLALRPEGKAPGEDVPCAQTGYDDSAWRVVNLPHDWGVEGGFDQKLPGETGKLPWAGVGWYRKFVAVSAADCAGRVSLEIDGAMSYSAVWCNGRLVGGWPYGYASYRVDLTPYLHPGARNTLAVRLDNPPDSSRWYPGGGLYRNVWLLKTPPVRVEPWGICVTTPDVSAGSATIEVTAQLANASATPAHLRVTTQIFKLARDGKPAGPALVTAASDEIAVAPAATATAATRLVLAQPRLWDVLAPELYRAVTLVRQDGKIVDRCETAFGIRTVRFTATDGLQLNGRRVPIQGVCLHHDLGALGAAFNTRAAERQLEILREMGVNAIRCAHNPPAPELLALCDRLGILVMDELTDTWTQPKKPNGYARLFADWAEADLRAMIRRDRNHPSVILWSIGNEVGEQHLPELHPIAAKLSAIAHAEDPTRPTTSGCDFPDAGFNGFNRAVDVFSYNYKPGLYAKFHAANPGQPLYGSETASTISTRGEYLFPVGEDKAGGQIGFQMSSYDLYAPGWATTPDTEFRGQDENPSVAGEFVWTGFDYLGEPTPYNADLTILTNYHTPEARAQAEAELKAVGKIAVPSRSSYFGIVDLAGFKKDRFYLYQARWRPDLPMAHILPHWNWPERVGAVTPVHVYTSGDEAELFLNGQSLGRRKKGRFDYRLRWDDVKYAPGELKVVAYKNGREWATDTVKTTGPAARLQLAADRAAIQADGRDLSFVTVTVADRDGLPVPRSHPKLTFTLAGPGEIVATDNGDPTDHTAFSSAERAAFNGLALVIVRARPGAARPITLRVTSEGLAPAEVKIAPVR